jgi:hypothetical protein
MGTPSPVIDTLDDCGHTLPQPSLAKVHQVSVVTPSPVIDPQYRISTALRSVLVHPGADQVGEFWVSAGGSGGQGDNF